MTFFGFEICSLALFIVGLLIVIKFYAIVSCGYFRENVKLNGKTVIVTGANGGIGKETAKEIAKRGARVIMACRNIDRAKIVRDEIVEATKNENVVVRKLDLSSQKSIREFAEGILKTEQRLDVLIHNAGTAENRIIKTEDNIELTMATNYFGPFLLTHLLIDLLKSSTPSRIVLVLSETYRLSSVNLNDLNPSRSWFPLTIYFTSKYASLYFTNELARRLKGVDITANCLHPGLIDTEIWKVVSFPLNWLLKLIMILFFKTPLQGCQTTVYLACSSEVQNVTGKYFIDCKESSVLKSATDESKAKKLWELSEQLVNLKPSDPKI